MSLESDLFKRKRPDFQKLLDFGFEKKENAYLYETMLPTDEMKACITVDSNGEVSGMVIDPFSEEEYIAIHTPGNKGTYAAQILAEYLEVLEKIAAYAFHPVAFVSSQMNRMDERIRKKYGTDPEHPFKKAPENIAYYHHENRKWFALIQIIDYGKIDAERSGEVEVLDLKTDPKKEADLLKKDGIYQGWHMNRKNWISIPMDDSLKDEEVWKLIESSFDLTASGSLKHQGITHWLIPANPSYFDLDHAFQVTDEIEWKQSSKVKPGDLLFMYYGSPFSEIRYLVQAVKVNIPYTGWYEGPVKIRTLMRIHKLFMFDDDRLKLNFLKKYGVTTVRGPRYMPEDLEKKIAQMYPEVNEILKQKEEEEKKQNG